MTKDNGEARTRFVFSIALGGIMILAGVLVIVWDVLSDGVAEMWVSGVGVALVLLGGVAALPGTFVPIFSTVMKKLPGAIKEADIELPRPEDLKRPKEPPKP